MTAPLGIFSREGSLGFDRLQLQWAFVVALVCAIYHVHHVNKRSPHVPIKDGGCGRKLNPGLSCHRARKRQQSF